MRPDYEWLATLVFGSALVLTANILIFAALWGGVILDTFSKPDPTVMRGLTEAAIASQAFGLILIALFEASAGYAILATRALPRWIGWFGICYAVLTLAAFSVILDVNGFMEGVFNGLPFMIVSVCLFMSVVGGSMMSIKRETLAPKPREPELQEVQ